MIIYSVQNRIDMNPIQWVFNDAVDRFYNWKNQPIRNVSPIPARDVKCQFSISDKNVSLITSRVVAAGQQISAASIVLGVDTIDNVQIFDLLIKPQIVPINTPFYVEIEIEFSDAQFDNESYRSSCFMVRGGSNDAELIKIAFGNTVSNRFIAGILFYPDTLYTWHVYLKKYDGEIETVEDETEADFQGNKIVINKTHNEIDIFELIDMPKKLFMGLLKISENDVIYVNGRRANCLLYTSPSPRDS